MSTHQCQRSNCNTQIFQWRHLDNSQDFQTSFQLLTVVYLLCSCESFITVTLIFPLTQSTSSLDTGAVGLGGLTEVTSVTFNNNKQHVSHLYTRYMIQLMQFMIHLSCCYNLWWVGGGEVTDLLGTDRLGCCSGHYMSLHLDKARWHTHWIYPHSDSLKHTEIHVTVMIKNF